MAISETKMKIVIENYFKTECDVDTSIREAFEKGFRIGVMKGMQIKSESPTETVDAEPMNHGHWIYKEHDYPLAHAFYICSECGYPHGLVTDNYCPHCGAQMDERDRATE